MKAIEKMIQEKAYELEYEKCGIIPISLMKGYVEKFEERMEKIPQSRPFYERQQRLINQDVCPMNKEKWKESEEFLGLEELAPQLTPENILSMDECFYRENIQPKLFYLTPDELWKWKVNVLNYMSNNYKEEYKAHIINASNSEYEKVREIAMHICKELNL